MINTIKDAGAQRILATHGKTDVLVRYLREQGLDAQALLTQFDSSGDEGPNAERDIDIMQSDISSSPIPKVLTE